MPRPAAIAALAVTAVAAVGGVVYLLSSGGVPPRGARTTPLIGSLPSISSGASASSRPAVPEPAKRPAPPAPHTSASATAPDLGAASPPLDAALARTVSSVEVDVPMDEVDKLAGRVKLRPEQAERLRAIFRDASEEMARMLREYSQSSVGPDGSRAADVDGFKRITEAAARRIEADVRAILDPEQLPAFEDIVLEDRRAREKER